MSPLRIRSFAPLTQAQLEINAAEELAETLNHHFPLASFAAGIVRFRAAVAAAGLSTLALVCISNVFVVGGI